MSRARPTRSRSLKWIFGTGVLALMLLLAIAWLLPRRVYDIVSVDGQHRWQHSSAPPQQRIVWQPAERLPATVELTEESGEAAKRTKQSLVRPQLTDGGTTLYFTLQRDDEPARIFRSRFDGTTWSPATAVEELNSGADDFGPVISADGQQLYLYSNRPGGYGGFDLYVSYHTSDGWSTPENLGPRINTPANEYDPAITPDGKRLFFSSNRTPAMQERVAKLESEPGEAAWKATLRAEPGLRQFDIYLASRNDESDAFETPQPLREINTSASNEGEPYVSPNGAFLYFASDRTNTSGENANYDIYRARIAGDQVFGMENLGPGVNTFANEHDPALSPEGFRILFSSDRMEEDGIAVAPGDAYALYVSQASEIYDDAGWDTSHLALITDNLWFIVLLLLIAALIAALIWYLRQVSLKRAPIPAFFLIALLLHLLLATGAFFVPLDGVTLVDRIRNNMDKITAANVELDSSQPAKRPRENAYEKVADLQAAESADVSQSARQQAQPEAVVRVEDFAAQTSSQPSRSRPAAPIAVTPPVKQPAQSESPQLTRQRRPLEQSIAANTIELEQTTAPQEQDSSATAQSAEVSTHKSETELQDKVASVSPANVNPSRPLRRETMDIQRVTNNARAQASDSSSPALPRRSLAMNQQVETPQVKLEQTTSPATSANASRVKSADVTAQRQVDSDTTNRIAAIFESPSRRQRSTPLQTAAIAAAQATPNMTPSRANVASESSLPRRQRLSRSNFAVTGAVPIDNQNPTNESTQAGLAATSPKVNVEIDRSAAGAPNVNLQTPEAGATGGSLASTVTPQSDTAAAAAALPSTKSTGLDAVAEMFSRKSNRPIEIAQGQITLNDTASQPTNDSSSGNISNLARQDVQQGRASDSASVLDSMLHGDASSSIAASQSGPSRANFASRQSLDGFELASASDEPVFSFQRATRTAKDGDAVMQAALEQIVGEPGAEESGETSTLSGPDVGVARSGELAELFAGQSLATSGKATEGSHGGLPGEEKLARVDLLTEFDGSSLDAPLGRRASRPAVMQYAQGKIGLQSMLRLRVVDDETKRDLIEAFGGRPDTLPAIGRGLTWLAKVQHEDGHWALHDFPKSRDGKSFSGQGSSRSDSAGTGLALLPFLGDGHTHLGGKYQPQVERGLNWLLEHQSEDGNLFTGGEGNAHMYSHGIAAIALCEAYGMTEDDNLREPAQKAIDYIVAAQHKEGGWRYRPGDAGDTSVVGWQVMALKSAQMAGLNVPQGTLNKASGYLSRVRRGKDKAEFGYQNSGGGTPAMTAEGLLCYQYLGAKAGDPLLMRTVEVLADRPPKSGQDTSYYWYYGTQAMFHVQGEPWELWNNALQEAVLSRQEKDGVNVGSWNPRDKWEKSGGRIMSTSLRLLMLEVSFRHLPLYQALD